MYKVLFTSRNEVILGTVIGFPDKRHVVLRDEDTHAVVKLRRDEVEFLVPIKAGFLH